MVNVVEVLLLEEVLAVEGPAVEGVSSSAPGADRGRLASTFMKNHMSLVIKYLYAYGNKIEANAIIHEILKINGQTYKIKLTSAVWLLDALFIFGLF